MKVVSTNLLGFARGVGSTLTHTVAGTCRGSNLHMVVSDDQLRAVALELKMDSFLKMYSNDPLKSAFLLVGNRINCRGNRNSV